MDRDSLSSFEETSFNKGQKFIALVVSDVSDFDDSFSNDNSHTIPTTINKNNSTSGSNRYSKLMSTPSKQIKRSSVITVNTNTTNSITNSNRKSKNDEKKRWSFISNHSSSSKKRWSSFTMDSTNNNASNNNNTNTQATKGNKRLSISSNISIHTTPKKNFLHNTTNIINNNNNTNDMDSIHSRTRSIENGGSKNVIQTELKTPFKKHSHHKTNSVGFGTNNTNRSNSNTPSKSIKRSSTSSSLRQFLNKIVTNNDNDNDNSKNSTTTNNNNHTNIDQNSINANKENIKPANTPSSNSKAKAKNHHHQPSNISDSFTIRNNIMNSTFATPKKTPTNSSKTNSSRLLHSKSHSQISDHYINSANRNNIAENLRNNNYINNHLDSNTKRNNLENLSSLNTSMDSLNLQPKRSSLSSISSLHNSKPKWKFWKKSNSSNNPNTAATTSNSSSNNNITCTTMERAISTYSHERQKLRSKNSFSDFHQSSFYNNSMSHPLSTTPMTTPSSSSIKSNKNNMHSNNNTISSFHELNSPIDSFINTNDIYTNNAYTNIIISNNNNNSNNILNSSIKKRTSTQSLSLSQLKHRTSQQSLKHKTSHSSLQKFTTRRKSITDDVSSFLTLASSIHSAHSSNNGTSGNNQISLPIPNQVSRDKIRTKLKNSTSLLSLNSSLPMNKKIYDETMLNNLLDLCTVKCVIEFDELDTNQYAHLETLSKNHSVQLSNKVWRATSTIDNSQTIICKKISLTNDDNNMIMRELNILNIISGTPGMPQILQCYILQDANEEKFLHIFLKDNGDPLSEIEVTSWSQCLKYFWQCVNILYVMETKFQFEHRNLTLNHILVDKNGNVTLCDLSTSRIKCPNEKILFSRLDHPIFFQGGTDYLFDTYNLMRSIFIHRNEQWDAFEPITNLIWLRYLLILVLLKNKDKTLMGPGREQLTRLMSVLECNISHSSKRSSHIFNKRKDIEVRVCGDLLRIK